MNAGHIVRAGVMLLACSGLACTAFVLSKLEPIQDYGLDDGGRATSSSSGSSGSTSSSGGAAVSECSLLYSQSGSASKPNECATCIESACNNELEDGCEPDSGKYENWFTYVRSCAKNPWYAYPDPAKGGSGNWGCSRYKDAGAPIAENSIAARERAAEICVNTKCMTGAEPKCFLCEITVEKPGSGNEISYLRDDECGKCIVDNCNKELIPCCSSGPVREYVEKCAFTTEATYREKCAMLTPENVADGGSPPKGEMTLSVSGWDSTDRVCAVRLARCIQDNCSGVAKCRAP